MMNILLIIFLAIVFIFLITWVLTRDICEAAIVICVVAFFSIGITFKVRMIYLDEKSKKEYEQMVQDTLETNRELQKFLKEHSEFKEN